MSSNTKLQQTQTIYLRQFFNNYFERKETHESISNFYHGLVVIQTLIEQFQDQHSLNFNHRKNETIEDSISINDINKETTKINKKIQSIYERLTKIFELSIFNSEDLFAKEKISSSRRQVSNDDELYQMLDSYKKQLKNEKQTKEKLSKQKKKLEQCIKDLEAENLKQKNIIKASKKHVQQLKKEFSTELQTYEIEIVELKQTICGLTSDLQSQKLQAQELKNSLASLDSQIKQKQKSILSLKQQLLNQKQINSKMLSMEQLVRRQFRQKQNYFKDTINQAISKQQIINKPVNRLLRQFINASSKIGKV